MKRHHWTAEEDALLCQTYGLETPLVMRFHGPGTLDLILQALERHRNDVWPGASREGG